MPASADRRGLGSGKRRSGNGGGARRRAADLGEFELLAKVRKAVERLGRGHGVLVGIGDDAAVVEAPRARGKRRSPPLVLTTDTMVEGVHFRASWLAPRELGVRAFRAAVSDIAAMGARPLYVLLSLELPGAAHGFGPGEALELVRALAVDARRAGAALVGGNVSGGARTGVTVTVVGEAAGKPLLRSGAKPGDLVFVTGSLGGAAAGWRTLTAAEPRRRREGSARSSATSAFRRPPLRLSFAAALAESGLAHAMVDVSDGLLQDLGHVAAASRVAIRIDAGAVPIHRAARPAAAGGRGGAALELALSGGEDYELVFTAPARHHAAIGKLAAARRTPLCVIGVVRKGRASVTDASGAPFALASGGFDHLRPRHARTTVRR